MCVGSIVTGIALCDAWLDSADVGEKYLFVKKKGDVDLTKERLILITLVALILVLGAYLTTYSALRQHRLSFEYAKGRMLFNSIDEAHHWRDSLGTNRDTTPLLYEDSAWLYIIFWPAIQIDSAISGREVDPPGFFGMVKPYKVPSVPPRINSSQHKNGASSF